MPSPRTHFEMSCHSREVRPRRHSANARGVTESLQACFSRRSLAGLSCPSEVACTGCPSLHPCVSIMSRHAMIAGRLYPGEKSPAMIAQEPLQKLQEQQALANIKLKGHVSWGFSADHERSTSPLPTFGAKAVASKITEALSHVPFVSLLVCNRQ